MNALFNTYEDKRDQNCHQQCVEKFYNTYSMRRNTKTFSQENEKDQKQNEKYKKIFHLQKNYKTMKLYKYPEMRT